MKKIKLLSLFLLALNFIVKAQEPQFADYEPTYTQDFNLLPTGSETELIGTWTNNVTIPGWYLGSVGISEPTELNNVNVKSTWETDSAAIGSKTGFVNIGHNFESDRALGVFISNAVGNGYYGVKIKNADEAKNIKSLKVKYVGEQWTSSHFNAQDLIFAYKVNATGLEIGSDEGWNTVEALKFTSPSLNTAKGKSKYINGNVSKNRVALEATFDVSIPKGDVIWLRWFDVNDESTDHILAIDDLEVTATFEDNTSVDNIGADKEGASLHKIAKNIYIIKSEKKISEITVYTPSGQLISTFTDLDSNEVTFNSQEFVTGVYFLRVKTFDNKNSTIKANF